MNRRIPLGICLLSAAGAVALLIYWSATSSPGAKELEYRNKEELAARRASTAMDQAYKSDSDLPLTGLKMDERQSALAEQKHYHDLAEAEMNIRQTRDTNFLSLIASIVLVCIASGAVLFLPGRGK